jgi:hypothetical protein
VSEWTTIGPLAYCGKKGCTSVTCTRMFIDGKISPDCRGWHCSYCDAPCGSQGHRCPASEAILGEARRIADEQAGRGGGQ